MSSFDSNGLKNELIIIATTTGILFLLNVVNIKPPKASLKVMNIMKVGGGIRGGVFVKGYAVCNKWISK